jgi:hypothetical protein
LRNHLQIKDKLQKQPSEGWRPRIRSRSQRLLRSQSELPAQHTRVRWRQLLLVLSRNVAHLRHGLQKLLRVMITIKIQFGA